MTFTLKVSGTALSSAAAPSWSGAAVGNTAFLGISGRPILYQTGAGTTTITISNIALTPPPGSGAITAYMFVAADAESTNENETLRFQTNGGAWSILDQVGPTTGNTYPTAAGAGTASFTETGVPGTVGAYIVGSTTPTQVTTTLVGGGLQGAMFAVRFASIRLNMQIQGARVNSADQFKFEIASTTGGSVLASGTSSGTTLGPFNAAALVTASSLPLTVSQAMASGSANTISHYRSMLTCTNASPSSTPLPTAVTTSSYNFGALQFGDNVVCVFTNTPYPHLQLTKALGAGGRQFPLDQFTPKITQGNTVVASSTTGGTGSTLTNASTPQLQVTTGTAYAMSEDPAGTTLLSQYTVSLACTNSNAGSTTVLPTSSGGAVTLQMGDVVACTITNTKRPANAALTLTKTSSIASDPVNGSSSPFSIPGAVVYYSIAVSNTGPAPVDNNSVLVIDTLPPQIEVGSAASPSFAQGTPSSNLTFTAATDIRYSNAAAAPTSYAACTYTPQSAYDPAVRYVCLNPKGIMAGSSGTPPGFTISFSARVK